MGSDSLCGFDYLLQSSIIEGHFRLYFEDIDSF